MSHIQNYPHQAAIRFKYSKEVTFCGGTVISDKWIISAAHCTFDMNSDEILVTVGHTARNYFTARMESSFQESEVTAIVEHPGRPMSHRL